MPKTAGTKEINITDSLSQRHKDEYKKIKSYDYSEIRVQQADGDVKTKYIETRTLENGVKKNYLYRLDKGKKKLFDMGKSK
jgi:hypothetical protein